MPKQQLGPEFDPTDTEILATAAIHGLLTIAKLHAENPNSHKHVTHRFLLQYVQRLADPNISMSRTEDEELHKRLYSLDPEALRIISDVIREPGD